MASRFAKGMEIDPAEGALLARTIRANSKSFDMASMMLPMRYRLPARALYAFCRSSDDAVDEPGSGVQATAMLRRRLDAIYDGKPGHALEDRAFALVAQHHRIPYEIPAALLEGFEWDEAGRRYETLDDLLGYAARVASTIGVMMCFVMDRRERHVLGRAAELGLAMQLTNIARDVGEDAARGRIYLPLSWLREADIDPDELTARPMMSRALGGVVHRLLQHASILYAQGFEGIAGLPAACRPAICAAGLIYRAIGDRIEANGFDSVGSRARTSTAHKLALAGWGTVSAFSPWPVPDREVPASVRFLVEQAEMPVRSASASDAAIGRFLDILATLEARERRITQATRSGFAP